MNKWMCEWCEGKGDLECPTCEGSGVEWVLILNSSTRTYMIDCRECDGFQDIACPECLGTGQDEDG